ncbi:16638_t:CDS:2 [Acaulospora colombiana]|uniref:16638_t:CDS:1 n=1 Tax=Acaulospora colombiana TaxID=27376 RepID=A0ACA9JXV5_9GLOM|nr:16638_t:CDS:2 [Acaulospora colombiana]
MNKRNFKPLAVLREEVQHEYFRTREEFYNAKRVESKAFVRESSKKIETLLVQRDRRVKEFSVRFTGDAYPSIETLSISKGKTNSNNSKTSLKVKHFTAKIDINIEDYLSTGHRKKHLDKRQAGVIPIQNEIPKYALWTPIARSSKTEDDPVLRHLYYFGEDSEDDDDVDYFDVYEESIVGKNVQDPEDEKIAVRTMHRIFMQNNISLALVEKSTSTIDSEPSKASSTPSTTSRHTRSPVTANRSIPVDGEDDEESGIFFVEVVINALAKIFKGKDIKMLKSTRKITQNTIHAIIPANLATLTVHARKEMCRAKSIVIVIWTVHEDFRVVTVMARERPAVIEAVYVLQVIENVILTYVNAPLQSRWLMGNIALEFMRWEILILDKSYSSITGMSCGYDGEALKFVPLERERPPSPAKSNSANEK